MNERYLQAFIENDALKDHKMAFISGPRQVGKTTLAEAILGDAQRDAYFTWDDDEFRKLWLKNAKGIFEHSQGDLVVLDEIHKEVRWKSRLKGIYDLYRRSHRFIITGSARLDYYKKSGDSLQGRYIPYRLHPFSYCESNTLKPPPDEDWTQHASTPICDLAVLEYASGFPDPLFGGSENKARRWRKLYRERLVKEDLRDLQQIRELSSVENLTILLQDRVAGQLSYESLREDLGCSHDSIRRWLDLLEAFYFTYRLRPYTPKIKNALRKEPKLYFYDWGSAQNAGARWENLIAGHLLKNVQAWTDCAFGDFELFYIRDKQKREVDFLVTQNRKPYLLLEVKSNASEPTPALVHFQNVLRPTFCFQLVKDARHERRRSLAHPDVQVISAERFLAALN